MPVSDSNFCGDFLLDRWQEAVRHESCIVDEIKDVDRAHGSSSPTTGFTDAGYGIEEKAQEAGLNKGLKNTLMLRARGPVLRLNSCWWGPRSLLARTRLPRQGLVVCQTNPVWSSKAGFKGQRLDVEGVKALAALPSWKNCSARHFGEYRAMPVW